MQTVVTQFSITEVKMSTQNPLKNFANCLNSVPDPRSKQGQSHPFATALAVLILGLLANLSTLAEIQRWAEIHFAQLNSFLEFKGQKGKRKIPHAITFARILRKLALGDLQNAFAAFLNEIIAGDPIAAAVDGKVAKQMKDESGDPILMLNVFAQNLKIHLASWSVRGDKTNEPGCLKQHLGELFEMYPSLKLLTGDAIYAQRPLLEAIREYHRDYLVQIKDNQEKTHDQMKRVFANAVNEPPGDQTVCKKRAA